MAVAHPPTLAAPTETEPPRLKMTYEEFLAWSDEDTYAEWVDGEVIVHMPPKPLHQELATVLLQLLGLFAGIFDLGKIYTAPMQMKLPGRGPGREPDILFVSKDHAARVIEDRLDGPADLVIEIISDDSVSRDRDDKFYEYEAGGVPEYWILDPRPNRRRAFFYQLDERGQYRPIPIGPDGIYRSRALPGFWLNVAWLQGDEYPDPLSALAEIVGPEKLIERIKAGQSK